jgi:hypothetical protein
MIFTAAEKAIDSFQQPFIMKTRNRRILPLTIKPVNKNQQQISHLKVLKLFLYNQEQGKDACSLYFYSPQYWNF